MSESLALRYRPRTFLDLVGQRAPQLVLYRMIHASKGVPLEEPRVPDALLFCGSRGSGKTSTARILGAALNCTAPGSRPCTECVSCQAVQSGRSLDVIEIDAASNGLVADIRKLKEAMQYATGGAWRVVLLDEAQSMSREGFNALLKLLEEPPARTIFVLLTTEPGKILPTVLSRCSVFIFRRIPVPVIAERLAYISAREGFGAQPGMLTAIAERADGGMRDAIMLLDQVSRVGITTASQLEVLMGESDFGPSLVAAMADGDTARLFGKVDELLCQVGDYQVISARLTSALRDILVLGAGGSVSAQGEALAARQALAARLDARRITAALRVLWDLRTKVRGGTDPRSSLDLAAVMCLEVLRPKVPAYGNGHGGNGHAAVSGSRPMTMQEMAQAGR